MKNIETILSECGVQMTDEQKTAVEKAVGENYKPIADWQKQVDKVTNLTEQLTEAKDAMKKFEGVDPDALKNEIASLNQKLTDKDAEYQNQIADRDFQDNVKNVIAKYKGKNEKAIKALLDMDTLKASKNQNDDLDKAMKALTEAEDSKMLFGESDGQVIGGGNPIGIINKGGNQNTATNQMRSIMGLPPVNNTN